MPSSMSSGLAKPSSYIRMAALTYPMSRKLTMKPDRSLVRTGCLPTFLVNANAVSAVSGSVSSATTISTSFITGTGEKKWTPTTRPGCCTLPASSAMGMDEVFVAITLPGLTSSSSSLISDTFRSRISGTASITMSAPATSFRSGVKVIRASTSSRWASSILPCLTAPASDFSTRPRAASRNSGRSRTTTGMPAAELISRGLAAHLRRIGQICLCLITSERTAECLVSRCAVAPGSGARIVRGSIDSPRQLQPDNPLRVVLGEHQRPQPDEQRTEPVAPADQVEHVDETPHQVPGGTGEPDAERVCHGRPVPDGGHASPVEVRERRHVLVPLEPGPDHLADVLSLLDRGLGHAGQLVQRHHVADREHLGMARQRAVGQHHDPPGAIGFRAGRLGEHAGQW